MKKILLVDDDKTLQAVLTRYLEKRGYSVRVVTSGVQGLKLFAQDPPDLVVSDIMMPGMDGLEFCRRLRATRPGQLVPFIFLTAKKDLEDRIQGHYIGADDYITKPFSIKEMLARLRAVLRRRSPEISTQILTIGELHLDGATHRVTFQDTALKLGPTEFKLLQHLMSYPERVHSRGQLLDKVWGDHVYIEERTVDVHIKRLREALGVGGAHVETVRGTGYRITAQAVAVVAK
ncbi:MAG: hypothetical protein RI918_1966 [Pseudomonadota bacterium]